MSCLHAEDVCQHCLEKVQTTTENAPPEKVQTTTENAPPEKVQTTTENAPPEKTMNLRSKRFLILIHSSILVAGGAIWYSTTKNFYNMAIDCFDTILDIVATRTKQE